MRDLFHLAWRYLVFNRVKTGILVLSIALIGFLPIGLKVLVAQSSASLTARAESTPLVLGEKGSPLELVLNTLYFESDTLPEISHAQVQRIMDTGLATPIPLYNRFQGDGFPLVGTGLDYFRFRGLKVDQGRQMALLGECVLGAEVAHSLGRSIGDSVISTPLSVFDLAGVYPLKMPVVGVLEASGTPDDRAIFTDVKTTWVIAGLAHGHQDLSRPEAEGSVLKREANNIVANASVVHFNEITDANRDRFHFHGDPSAFPVTAVIALPNDTKSGTLLEGQFLGDAERMQIVRPSAVVGDLLETVLIIQNYLFAGAVLAGGCMLLTAILVFMLSLRLRQREIETMHRIGAPRYFVSALVGTEIAVVLILGMALAVLLTLLLANYGEILMRNLIL